MRGDRRWLTFICFLAVLILAFLHPIRALLNLAGSSELYSHLPLVPGISLYLLWLKRSEMSRGPASVKGALVFVFLGAGFLALSFGLPLTGIQLAVTDMLFLTIGSLVHFLLAGVLVCFGKGILTQALFPLLFLYLLAPMPVVVSDTLAAGLQVASGEVSHLLIKLSGTPVYRDGLVLHLPGLVIEVARECSGIRSSFVLFVTSLLAGYLCLDSNRMRVVLAMLVVPIGILRNGFRILTIAWLTVHVDSGIIHGPLHQRGGPFFFALSLGVFFIVLLLLRRLEKWNQQKGPKK